MSDDLPTATQLALGAAARLGMEVEVIDPEYGYLYEVRRGDRRRTFLGGRSPLNDAVAARLAEDKHYTAVLLERAGLRVPRTVRCLSRRHPSLARYRDRAGLEPGLRLADELGFPVVVKPNRLSHGRGVALVTRRPALSRAVHRAWELDAIALVQEHVEGRDLRLDFLDGAYLAGYERRPLEIRGDGKRNVEALVHEADPRTRGPESMTQLVRGGLGAALESRGWTPRTVPPEGATLALDQPIRNLNLGSVPRIVERVPAALRDACLAAGEALGLRHFGVDLRVDGDRVTVIEINASPLLGQIYLGGHREVAITAWAKVLEAALA